VTQERNDDVRLAEEDAVQADLRIEEAGEPDDPAADMTEEERAEAAEIRADIEQTRVELGGTLNELGDRLEPGHLMDQAKENVREATIGRVEDSAAMVMETIRRNPIPAALAGAGLLMLWKNRSTGMEHRYGAYRGSDSGSGSGVRRGSGQDIGSTAREAASTVRDNVGGAVGSAADGAQQIAGEAIDRAGQTVEQVGWKLDSFMQANPLAVGVIAIGAGAAVGSLVPETDQEREMLGDASRQVGEVVREKVDEASTKAEETLDRAEEKIGSPA
jgi:uncharacterized protein DUF3618